MKQSVTVGAQLLWSGCYGCNNGRYGCTIVMSYIAINKAVSQWLLTFNLCVSVTWPLTCAFHIPCTHTPEIIDMHRDVCDKKTITQQPKHHPSVHTHQSWAHFTDTIQNLMENPFYNILTPIHVIFLQYFEATAVHLTCPVQDSTIGRDQMELPSNCSFYGTIVRKIIPAMFIFDYLIWNDIYYIEMVTAEFIRIIAWYNISGASTYQFE